MSDIDRRGATVTGYINVYQNDPPDSGAFIFGWKLYPTQEQAAVDALKSSADIACTHVATIGVCFKIGDGLNIAAIAALEG